MTQNTPRPRRTRQLPTTEQLRIWRDFIETADALRAELTARLQSESSLSSGDYAVLLALSEAEGQRMRSSELAAHIDWERSRLSHHLGRMERRELIRREECAADNRGAEIVLTPTGLQAFRASTVPHLRAIRELFVDPLTEQELIAAGDLATTLRAQLGTVGRRRSPTTRPTTIRT
ncbi:MarR family winged helix-turn-helix transcriptional regulator [Catellatospora methionotrophica]|uniref:MarR family winged helix-turn-helix transcriptional regulator n=1 Tax=Catellatospora methionotrophica TaxID=121620 RepID=UPI0033F66981